MADVGVLFVHGIGEQQRADTLVQLGECLRSWFKRWLTFDSPQPTISVGVSDADLTQSATGAIPAHAKLRITADGVNTTWLLAESWWAASFAAPRYRDLWRWSLEIVPLAVADHFVRRFRLAKPWYRKLPEIALLTIAIALLPLLTLTMITSLVVGILPIPALRSAILGAQRILVGTVGDSYTLLESSIRGAAMVSRVQHDLRWLQTMARRTIIVAHSQGAAVAHAALQPPDAPRPEVFFTFGAGVRKLLMLDEIRGVARFRLWLLSGGLLLVSCGVWAMYRVLVDPTVRVNMFTAQGLDPTRMLVAFEFTLDLTNIFGISLLDWRHVTSVSALAGAAVGLLAFGETWRDRLLGSTLMGVFLAAMGLLFAFFMNVGPWSLMGLLSLVFGAVTFSSAFSSLKIHETDAAIDKRLNIEPPLRWLDRYTKADPVSNGPLGSTQVPFVDSQEVFNFGSPLLDHSGYWRNQDQFLPMIAQELADLAGVQLRRGEWDSERLKWAQARRSWRVRWLQLSRVLAAVVAVSVLVRFRQTLWREASDAPEFVATLFNELVDFAQRVPFLRLIMGDLAKSLLLQALWIGAVLSCVWVTYKLFEAVWLWWDRVETSALFARADYERPSVPFATLAAVLASAAALALLLTASLDRQAYELWTQDPSLLALRNSGWSGVREASVQPGVFTTVGVACGASYLLGFVASELSDWWMWGRTSTAGPRYIWRWIGYSLLGFIFALPAAAVMVGEAARTSQWVNIATILGVGTFALALIAVLWAMATTRLGRTLRQYLRDRSASPPFGRWLARGERGRPAVSRERLSARAMKLPVEWDEPRPRPLRLESLLSEEAAAIAGALVPPTTPDEERAIFRLTNAFPYAALTAAERVLGSDRSLARRLIAPHAEARARAIRRRIRHLERLIGPSEVETVAAN